MNLPGDLRDWLMAGDPAIRWQVLRDFSSSPPAQVAAERARVAREGWGKRLLDFQAADGQWGGETFHPNTWDRTFDTLCLLRQLGADPADERVQNAVSKVREHVNWGEEWGFSPFFEGEVEPCINGRVLALGAYFGHPSERLLERLLGEQLADGGWNCEAPPSCCGSFHTTICVLEGLLAWEQALGPWPAVTQARERGQEYLLARGLLRRRSNGEIVNSRWLKFSFPNWWHYDVLWALDYLCRAATPPDPRFEEALELVRAKRDPQGRWPLEHVHPGAMHFAMETEGEPSRWITLRVLRVLQWAARAQA